MDMDYILYFDYHDIKPDARPVKPVVIKPVFVVEPIVVHECLKITPDGAIFTFMKTGFQNKKI